jgi:4-hydroxybenzoate polyprenyltransferase
VPGTGFLPSGWPELKKKVGTLFESLKHDGYLFGLCSGECVALSYAHSQTMLKLKDITYFFQLSRPLNLLIAFLSFGVASYIALYKTGFGFLTDPKFWVAACCILGISATGYWINDVYDFRIDRINKPERTIVNALLSVKKVLTVYFVSSFGLLGISLIYFVFWKQRFYHIAFINLLAILLLFVYASYLKRISVLGNLVIAFLVSLVIILAGYLYHINQELMYTIAFAFQITLLREITKDVEDIRGDLQYNLQTLPIQIGLRATKKVLWVLYFFFLLSCYVPFVLHYLQERDFLWQYLVLSLLIVQLPVAYILVLLNKAQQPDQFATQSRYLKYVIITGIITILFLG